MIKIVKKIIDKKILHFRRTTRNQTPNLDITNTVFASKDALHLNIKALGYEQARQLRTQLAIPERLQPESIKLCSRACTQRDIESPWYWYWCQIMQTPVIYHRKVWEFAYILQALHEHNLICPGKRGLGFGCGEEPLPSIFANRGIQITATDLSPTESSSQGWIETNQSMSSVEKIWQSHLCEKHLFEQHVELEYVDMNQIPTHLHNRFDFCWSACALEHLGSIQNGLDFIENSLKTLVPGGLAIHTTEFNYLEDEETIDNWVTVLFRRKDFEAIYDRLIQSGHRVAPLNFEIGSGFLDRFIDLPPYSSEVFNHQQEAHLRLLVDGFASTSFGLIIQKSLL